MASVTSENADLQEDAIAHLEAALSRDLKQLPEARVLLGMTLGEMYLERGQIEEAQRHAKQAAKLAGSTRGVGRRDRERALDLLERTGAGTSLRE